MRFLSAFAAIHVVLLAIALAGFCGVAIGIGAALHFAVFVGTLVPTSQILGKIVKTTSELPPDFPLKESILLTFDDGPDPEITPQVLDLLDEYGAKAAFFVIGEKAQQHPEIVRDIISRGHVIGNHTQTHPERNFWHIGPKAAAKEIDQCQIAVREITGESPRLFRPPVGMHNPFVFDHLRRKDLPCVIWTHRSYDTRTSDVDRIIQRLTTDLIPGSILIIHDHLPTAPEVTRRVLETITSSRK